MRVSTAILLLLIALRTAWPAFAYSIKQDDEAKRTYAFVLTYVLYLSCWMSLMLSLLAPWIVRVLTAPAFYAGARVVPLLVFGGTAFIPLGARFVHLRATFGVALVSAVRRIGLVHLAAIDRRARFVDL